MEGKVLGRTGALCMLPKVNGYKELLNTRCMWWVKGVHRGPGGVTWAGHLGAQEPAVVRVVDYCQEQVQPNPPAKQQTAVCSRPVPRPQVCPVLLLLNSGLCWVLALLCLSVALPGDTRGQPVLQHSCWELGREFWAGMAPLSSAEAPWGCAISGQWLLPAGPKDGAPRHQQGPWALHLGFALAYTQSTVWCKRVFMEGNWENQKIIFYGKYLYLDYLH